MKFLLRLIVSVVLVVVIVWQLDGLAELGTVIAGADLFYVMLIIAVTTADRAFMNFKWILLLRAQSVDLPFFQGLKIYCVSSWWGLILPTTMGADLIRALMTARFGLDTNTVVTSIVIERMVGFIASLLLGLMSLFVLNEVVELGNRFAQVWWVAILLIAGAIAAFSISFSQPLFNLIYNHMPKPLARSKIIKRLREMHGTYLTYRKHKRALINFFLLTFAEQLVPIVNIWLVALALGVDLNIFVAAGVVPLATLITRIPVSVGGIGVLEGTFMLLMPLGGVSALAALSIALTDRLTQIIALLPWWLAYGAETKQLRKPELAACNNVSKKRR